MCPRYYSSAREDEQARKKIIRAMSKATRATSFEEAKEIIVMSGIKTKAEYYELCDRDERLTREPEVLYCLSFKGWLDYLSIEKKYYDLETCKKKVKEYLALCPVNKYFLDITTLCEDLYKKDAMFPPSDLWVEYYNVYNLGEIIDLGIYDEINIIF